VCICDSLLKRQQRAAARCDLCTALHLPMLTAAVAPRILTLAATLRRRTTIVRNAAVRTCIPHMQATWRAHSSRTQQFQLFRLVTHLLLHEHRACISKRLACVLNTFGTHGAPRKHARAAQSRYPHPQVCPRRYDPTPHKN
jgi:hypothetical protein